MIFLWIHTPEDSDRKNERLLSQVPARLHQWSTLTTVVIVIVFSALAGTLAFAGQAGVRPGQSAQPDKAATPLSQLVKEAEQNNPQILAARRGWQAATQVPSQVSTLPDPHVVVQQMSVGSPVPFAGYETSNFGYIGFGVSQDLPYPGKLRLRGERARRQAASTRDRFESVRRSIVEQVKSTY